MRIDIATLFTGMCDSVLGESIIGRAVKNGYIEIFTHDIRNYANNKHNRVDDKPYGGGTGIVMQAQPIFECVSDIISKHKTRPRVIYMSPQGEVLTQAKVTELAKEDGLVLLCGHYEGVDQRVLDELGCEEISIGDYVLTGGELPALILADAVARLQSGVLPNEDAYSIESHYGGLLEYPQYTMPREWRGRVVPQELLSGDHEAIDSWQKKQSLRVTEKKRPDMHESYLKQLTARFWSEFLEEKKFPADTKFSECLHFGFDECEANRLLKLTLRGKKRAELLSLNDCKISGRKAPKAGEYKILTDWDGIPYCVITTTKVQVLPFNEITDEMSRLGGECDTAAQWKKMHAGIFSADDSALKSEQSGDMPIIFEEFRVVYKKKK